MTSKEYLSQYKTYVMEIRGIEASINRLREQATSVTVASDGERVQSSGNKDKIGTLACQIADMQKECEDISKELKEIDDTIAQIDDARYRTLLRYRYIALYGWDRIASEMGYETRYTLRLHGQALLKVEEVLKNRH